MCPGLPVADVSNWRSAFLPGIHQGAHVDTRKTKAEELIENIRSLAVDSQTQRRQLDLLGELNRRHQETRAEHAALEARIQSFELAYRMQMAATEAFDLSREPERVRAAYGNTPQARQLLIAQRLIERGVRVCSSITAMYSRGTATAGSPRTTPSWRTSATRGSPPC
jgi:hypothetical protein